MFPFEPDKSSGIPLWIQLKQRLIYLINTGYYKPGDRLPTVRSLASEISINFNTVNKAYLSLASDGYIESTRGRGAFVKDVEADLSGEYAAEVDELIEDCITACRDLGLSLDDIQRCVQLKVKQLQRNEGRDGDGDKS